MSEKSPELAEIFDADQNSQFSQTWQFWHFPPKYFINSKILREKNCLNVHILRRTLAFLGIK